MKGNTVFLRLRKIAFGTVGALAIGFPAVQAAPAARSNMSHCRWTQIHRGDDPVITIEVCSKLIKKNPSNAEAYEHRAWAYNLLRQYAEAIGDYRLLVPLYKDQPFKKFYVHLNLGRLYARLDMHELAVESYTAAFALEKAALAVPVPGKHAGLVGRDRRLVFAEHLNARARSYEEIGEPDKAAGDYLNAWLRDDSGFAADEVKEESARGLARLSEEL